MPATSSRRLAAVKPPPITDKRDAILKAAVKVFAQNGFFQSQVADVARVAGVAAGTVYLYFRSKDDLLVSIFERTMKDAIDEGKAALAGVPIPRTGSARSRASISNGWAATATSPWSCQVELRQSIKFMERFSSTHLQDYFEPHPPHHRRGPGVRRVSPGHQRQPRRQGLLRRARRDGDQLDAQPPEVRPGRRRRRGGRPADWRPGAMSHINVSSVTVLGAGTMGAQIALHFANVGIPSLLLDLTADVARKGLDKARELKPDPQFTPDAYALITTGGFDTHLDQIAATDWVMEAIVERLDIKQQLLARVDEKRRPGTDRQHEHVGHPDRGAGRRPIRRFPPPLARHALLQSAPLPATAGDHPDRRDRSRGGCRRHAGRRPRARQGRRGGEGHAELHRQSHRALRRRVHAAGARQRQVHDRGDRRDHRAGHRPPGLRDVPDHGHRRRGRAGARDAEPERAPGGRPTIAPPSPCPRSWTR